MVLLAEKLVVGKAVNVFALEEIYKNPTNRSKYRSSSLRWGIVRFNIDCGSEVVAFEEAQVRTLKVGEKECR